MVMARPSAVRPCRHGERSGQYNRGRWAYSHPRVETTFSMSHSRLTGVRFQDYLGLERTLANLPDFQRYL